MDTGTNRIAAHLGISPGNLYYHFRNREEIVQAAFDRLEEAMGEALASGPEPFPWPEMGGRFLRAPMSVVWAYRFFYADLVGLVRRDPVLGVRYQALMDRTLARIRGRYGCMVAAGVMTGPLDDREMEALVLNTWLVAVNWVRYLQLFRKDNEISAGDFQRGVYQVLTLTLPYLSLEVQAKARNLVFALDQDSSSEMVSKRNGEAGESFPPHENR
jgi:AcrR family transcriptional regulator